MSALDLEPIKERLAAARRLPVSLMGCEVKKAIENPKPIYRWAFDGTWNDANLCAHAPSDLAALISEVERLRATVIVEQNRRQPWVKLAHQNAQEVKRLRKQVEAVRAATANHPDPCEKHPDGDTVSCGWKSAYRDVVRALEVGE